MPRSLLLGGTGTAQLLSADCACSIQASGKLADKKSTRQGKHRILKWGISYEKEESCDFVGIVFWFPWLSQVLPWKGGSGLLYFLMTATVALFAISVILCIIDLISLICMSDDDFNKEYNSKYSPHQTNPQPMQQQVNIVIQGKKEDVTDTVIRENVDVNDRRKRQTPRRILPRN